MTFDIQQFFILNKRFFIWIAFFGLLYLARGLFGLIFLTYILGFIFNNLIERFSRITRLSRRLWTVILYMVFVSMVVMILATIGPRLGTESTSFVRQMPRMIDDIHGYLDQLAEKQANWAPYIVRAKEHLRLETIIGMDRNTVISLAIKSINQVTHYTSYFFLGTLFSFLILLDFPGLCAGARSLADTRLKDMYEQTAESVVQFALVVGEAFQAQIIIALINTSLTALGLLVLKIHPVSLLCTIVFFAGLIPVLGVFISSVPILLVAFNIGGLHLMLLTLIMIVLVHALEAYVLNPNIFSAVFRINPVLTLIILYIGHRMFGMWGVLLGVPVSVYIYRYAILGPSEMVSSTPNVDPPGSSCGKPVS
jgi:predicted PurR-regulated permease PerM